MQLAVDQGLALQLDDPMSAWHLVLWQQPLGRPPPWKKSIWIMAWPVSRESWTAPWPSQEWSFRHVGGAAGLRRGGDLLRGRSRTPGGATGRSHPDRRRRAGQHAGRGAAGAAIQPGGAPLQFDFGLMRTRARYMAWRASWSPYAPSVPRCCN